MHYRRRLRSRIIISFLLFGTGLTALFAGITLVMREWLEEELIESTLKEEVDKTAAITRVDRRRGAELEFQTVRGWTYGPNRFSEVPFKWREFPSGVHDIEEFEDGKLRAYKLAVHRADDLWVFLRYDVTEQRRTRDALTFALICVVGAFAALSLLIAFWLSKRVLQPVTDLAGRVRQFEERPVEPLATHYADDEVGQLAAALDDYAAQLTERVARDREFNADVSHELRTPLAVIRGATELLLTQELPEKTRERIRRIDRAARQCTELTQALLLLSRNERQGPTEGETSDVAAVVEQVIDTHRPTLANKPVAVRMEKHAAARVEAPPAVLAVALGNLIGNAFKYTAQGEVVVRVESDRVVVDDTGPGFAADEGQKLFERGYRGQNTSGKGAGLGLAIVRRLCELYRWTVTLEPRPESGARAVLRFA